MQLFVQAPSRGAAVAVAGAPSALRPPTVGEEIARPLVGLGVAGLPERHADGALVEDDHRHHQQHEHHAHGKRHHVAGVLHQHGASDAPANQPTVVPAADAPRPHPNTRTYDRSVRFATLASRHHTMRMNRLYAMLTSSPWMTPRPPNNGTTRLPKHVRMMMG